MMTYRQDKRSWFAGAAVAAVAIGAAGWFGLISPQLSSTSSLHAQADSVALQNVALKSRVARLQSQSADLGKLTDSLRQALAALPYDSGLPAFTRQLNSQAKQNQIALTSITVGAIVPATGAGGAAAAPPAAAGKGSVAGTVYAIPVTLVSAGSAVHQFAFLKAIQVDGPRRALVTSSQLAAGSESQTNSVEKSSTMTVELKVFTQPLSPLQQAQLQKLLTGDITN